MQQLDPLEALVDESSRELDAAGVVFPPAATLPVKRFGPYHAAAAVLATFDAATLRPALDADLGQRRDGDLTDTVETLLADSKIVLDAQGRERWALRRRVRREVLRCLATRERIERALAANAEGCSVDDPVQEMFEAYLRGTAPPVESLSARQVTGSLEVAYWLEGLGIVSGVPEIAAIQRCGNRLALLQPLFDIAGVDSAGHTAFAGRAIELAELRDYVGVLPPGSIGAQISRIAAAVFSLHEKSPLIIWGPGGRGKSTLVSRFIWEHATLPNAERFPFAYLDFDRPGLVAEEPLTLLIEAVRQLGIQYPEAAEFTERIRADWLRELSERPKDIKQVMRRRISADDSTRAARLVRRDDQEQHLRDFASLLSNLKVESQPFLFVLDTFERVQYRSDVVVQGLCEFLQRFQQHVPRLRTVIAGRAPLSNAPFPTRDRELGDFDEDAAIGYLTGKGVSSREAARQLYTQVGGNPLSLRLAAEQWKQSGDSALEGVKTRSLLGFRVEDNEVQAQLFARVLNHINDPDVRKLAYPGLVLRRITPDIIRVVLAEPCGVDVPDRAAAERLFNELSREVGLVAREGDALVHRADVRRLVMRLLRMLEPSKVQQIEEAAVAYYASRDNLTNRPAPLVERAEEIYHRLSLRQPLEVVADRWQTGVEPQLVAALDELGMRERAWLKPRVGGTLNAEERELAHLDGWERDTLHRVRDLMQLGRSEEALKTLQERTERLPGSPLYALEAELTEGLERWEEARRIVKRGIRSADESGQRDMAIVLRARGARVDMQRAALSDARQKLDDAESLLQEGMTQRAIEVALHRLALLRAEHASDDADPGGRVAAAPVKRSLREHFTAMPDAAVRRESALAAWVGTEIGADYTDVLQRILRLTGLSSMHTARTRSLALALTAVDAAQPVPGRLADKVGAPSAASLTERWTHYTRSATPPHLGTTVAGVLADAQVGSAVAFSVVTILRERARVWLVPGDALAVQERQAVEEESGRRGQTQRAEPWAGSSSGSLRLTGLQLKELRDALLDAFPTRARLEEMLFFNLDRRLDAIAPVDSLETVVFMVIQAAEKEGWSAQLVAAARESNPGNVRLQEFAAKFGLAADVPEPPVLERVIHTNTRFVDPTAWRQQLGLVESQVCRLEIGQHAYATAFLVGPDLILTTFHAVQSVIVGAQNPRDVAFRFDYKRLSDGAVVNSGTLYHLAEQDWLVNYSAVGSYETYIDPNLGRDLGPDELNYALMRLARPAGADPVGGDRADPNAPARRWINVSSDVALSPGETLIIVQHPHGGPLQIALGEGDSARSESRRTRLFHRVNTLAGSDGSPCFNSSWELIAMHIASDPQRPLNIAISTTAILEHLKNVGLDHLLNQMLT